MKYYMRTGDLKNVGFYLGHAMQAMSIIFLIPLIVFFIYHEKGSVYSFIIPSLLSFSLGTLLTKIQRNTSTLKLRTSMIIAVLVWLWAGFCGALILMMYLDVSFINALVESISAWTDTGITMFTNVEILPKSILFLRSLEQWIGGIGVVTLAIGTVISSGASATKLYTSEAREDRIRPSIVNTMKVIWGIYILFTLIGIVAYGLAGMHLFDAVNLCLTSISTGGMSIKNANVGAYGNNVIYIITMILMLLGGTSFLLHYRTFTGKFKSIFKDPQLRAMTGIIIVGTILIYLSSKVDLMSSVFHVISAVTTTGASLGPSSIFVAWTPFTLFLLVILMIFSGTTGSTTGGIKLNRVIIMFKSIAWEFRRILAPKGTVIRQQLNGRVIKDYEVRSIIIYILMYFIFICIGWAVFLFYGYDPLGSLFDIVTCQGNVGLSMGVINPNIAVIPKIMAMINMIVGRLEIIPVVLLVRSIVEVLRKK